MELVGELLASHHLASSSSRGFGRRGGGGVGFPLMRLHRDTGQTPHHPNISPHISHAVRAEKRTAALPPPPPSPLLSLFFVKLFGAGTPWGC